MSLMKGKARIVRSELTGTFYVLTSWVERPDGTTLALRKYELEPDSAAELAKLRDAEDWLRALLEATGLTREQLADKFDLTIGKP